MATRTAAKPADPEAEKVEPEAPPAPTGEKAPEASATVGDVKTMIVEALTDFFGPGDAPAEPAVAPAEPAKPLSPREEESRMEELVRSRVDELLAAEPPEKKKDETKSEPEVPPAQAVRRATKALWGDWS